MYYLRRCSTPEMSALSAACTEGMSLALTVRKPSTPTKPAAFYQWPRAGMGYTYRSIDT